MLSESLEDYLKTVFELEQEHGRATTKGISARLEIAPASVSEMLKRLASSRPRLVSHEAHRGATLTAEGRRRALNVVRRHRLLELFLRETLGYPLEEVHAEAERLEHAVSEQFSERLAAYLGEPEFDPHGHPIPTREGRLPGASKALNTLEPKTRARVTQIPDADPKLVCHLREQGLLPGAVVEVVERAPYTNSLIVRAREAERVIGETVAAKIGVEILCGENVHD